MPPDAARFFSRVQGGNLFYRDDPAVPQIGCHLAQDFAAALLPASSDKWPFPKLTSLFPLAHDPENPEFRRVCLDLGPERFGRVYQVAVDFGEPPVILLAGLNFTAWLEFMIEVRGGAHPGLARGWRPWLLTRRVTVRGKHTSDSCVEFDSEAEFFKVGA